MRMQWNLGQNCLRTPGFSGQWTGIPLTRFGILVVTVSLLLVPGAGGDGKGDYGGSQETANNLYVIAKTQEGQGEILLAMRTFTAAYRLLPKDKRFLTNARRIAGNAMGVVRLEHESVCYNIPVLKPPINLGSQMPPLPLIAGSADNQVGIHEST